MLRRVCALAYAYECLHNLEEGEEENDIYVYIRPFGWELPFNVCPHNGDNLRIQPMTEPMGYEVTAANWN